MLTLCENRLAIRCQDSTKLAQIRNIVFSLDDEGREIVDFNRLKLMPYPVKNLPDSERGWRGFGLLKEDPASEIRTDICYSYFRPWHNSLFGEAYIELAEKYGWKVGDLVEHLKANPHFQESFLLDLALGEQYLEAFYACGKMNWTEWQERHWGCRLNVEPDYCGDISVTESSIEIFFATEYKPPLEWLKILCDSYPDADIELQYFNQDESVTGEFYHQNGISKQVCCDDVESIRRVAALFSLDVDVLPDD